MIHVTRLQGQSMVLNADFIVSVEQTPEGMKNRYYYHWLFDTDSDIATGFKNDAYEGNPTGLAKPIGVDLVVMIGWRDGKPNGIAAYDPLVGDDSPLVVDYTFATGGDSVEASIPLADLGLTPGQLACALATTPAVKLAVCFLGASKNSPRRVFDIM